jgi:hypothetical protein
MRLTAVSITPLFLSAHATSIIKYRHWRPKSLQSIVCIVADDIASTTATTRSDNVIEGYESLVGSAARTRRIVRRRRGWRGRRDVDAEVEPRSDGFAKRRRRHETAGAAVKTTFVGIVEFVVIKIVDIIIVNITACTSTATDDATTAGADAAAVWATPLSLPHRRRRVENWQRFRAR